MNAYKEIVGTQQTPNYLHPFTSLASSDSYEDVKKRILDLKAVGIRSMDLMWRSGGPMMGMGLSPFNSDAYWERLGWVVELCRENGMTFMIQDAAPFPTGQADGWFEKPEYQHLNKLYLSERHLDVKGPNPRGAFLIDQLIGAVRTGDILSRRSGARPISGANHCIAIIAMRKENGTLLAESAVDLTDRLRDGIVSWAVPEGIWRLFAVYETRNGGGRQYYMNLLDRESVALNIQAVHQPHYLHLKDEIGKTWLGFFYDETEVGNLNGYCFDERVGQPQNIMGESMALPWSREMEGLCRAAWGENYRTLLPLLWFEDQGTFHRVRCRYMDLVSRLIRENYNGQMLAWCRERGIQYIGHNLEDENSHSRLACGPAHYFRMQAHQDMAGIDLIGNQIMPGKDFNQAWYGFPEGDGQFYHYGLAKLASSAAHINPEMHGRSFCEVFAVYGALAGTRLRKFLYDHLFVNGINELIPADPRDPGVDARYTLRETGYANRMCHLLQHTRPVIKTAVLYHAEAEWYGGAYQMFQEPASELAKHQISYDIVPADVFEERDFYQTDCSDGLVINGNRYEALIIPGAEGLPGAVAGFLHQAAATGFPVFWVDRQPDAIAETGESYAPAWGRCVALADLAAAVEQAICPDLTLKEAAPDLRYSHFTDESGDYYMLHNEGKPVTLTLTVPTAAPAYRLDADKRTITRLGGTIEGQSTTMTLTLDEFEAAILCFTDEAVDAAPEENYSAEAVQGPWTVTLADEAKTALKLDALADLNGPDFFPRYTGEITYETTVTWDHLPEVLDLGEVYEIAAVYVNGTLAGEAQFAPYRVSVAGLAKTGENSLKIVVQTNTARAKTQGGMFAGGMGAATYNSLDPGGLLGPVNALFRIFHFSFIVS